MLELKQIKAHIYKFFLKQKIINLLIWIFGFYFTNEEGWVLCITRTAAEC